VRCCGLLKTEPMLVSDHYDSRPSLSDWDFATTLRVDSIKEKLSCCSKVNICTQQCGSKDLRPVFVAFVRTVAGSQN